MSRTITSYFQPQHKVPTSELSSKDSARSQIQLIGGEIKQQPEPEYLPCDPLRKQRGEVKLPPVLLPTVDSKQQLQYPIATTAFPRESNELSAKQSGPSAMTSRMPRTQKTMDDAGMQSELREIAGKSMTTMQCQSQNVQNFCASSQFKMQPENTSLSTRLWTRNVETTRSLVVEDNNSTSPAQKINAIENTVILSGESERRKIAEAKPLIPIRDTNLQRNSADTILHAAIISSSSIQEQTIWTANKWYLLFFLLRNEIRAYLYYSFFFG